MKGLTEIYETEQDAQRATVQGDLNKAIHYHDASIKQLALLINELGESNKEDQFDAVKSLKILKDQITSRISQLKIVQESNNKSKISKLPSVPITNGVSLKDVDSTSNRLLNYINTQIQLSLLQNLNIRLQDVPHNAKSYKVPLIDKEKINNLEHSLQLMNFKDKSKDSIEDLKTKNDCLSKLNMLYYSELLANHESIRNIIYILKDVNSGKELNKEWDTGDTIDDATVLTVVDELQQKVANLERDKVMMENQIVKLKERWNSLVESARKRKDMETKPRQEE